EVLLAADRSIKYKEENRQILKESIEVAPFTAKIQRPTDPGLDRDRERSKDPAFPVRIPALASSSPKTSHPHPHVIQSEKSGYFTILSNSVVNEPPRLYPSKEQSSYYDKVSLGAPVVGVSVGTGVQSQGTQSLVSYSSKASLSKPPPLIKHQPEGGEGLAGKITEHLSQQAILIQHQHLTSMDRKDRHSPATSNTFSTSPSLSSVSNHHQQQQHHLRAMPSLYRAPVYHPPIQLSLERKETAEREKEREKGGYGGRLSPPTLTPIQPVSLATAGTTTSVEQQKPPTLVPELRDVKLHGITAAVTSVASAISGNIMNDGLRGREMIQERGSLFCRKKEVLRGKPQAAVASVIVRPATSIKYENPVGANKFGATVHKEVSASYPSKLPGECPHMRETAQEPGGGRVIQPISNLEDISAQYNKTTSMQSSQGPVGLSTTNSLCRSPVVFSLVADVQNKNPKSGYSARDEFGAARTGIGGWLPSLSGAERNSHEGVDSRSMSPGLSLPLSNSAETTLQGQSINLMSSPISDSNKTYSPSFVHLKKHKAALAAAQSKTNLPAAPTSMPTGNSSLTLDPVEKSPDCSSTPPPCSSVASSGDISNTSSATGSTAPGKSSLLPNGQTSGSALLAQSSNYHKLKKAWLTRHSEEDKTATTASFSTKAEKLLTTMTSTCNTTAMSDMIKPCTVNLSASTSSEIDLNKDSGIKSERDRNLEGRSAGSTAAGGGGEERKSVHFSRRGCKRSYDSGSESGGDDSDTSESKMEGRAKRQSKPTYKKKQNDMAKKRGDHEKEEEDVKPNGIFRSAREKTKLKLASSNGIPRSVLKDWRKVKKLKQTGESFLQDDSCSEIGPNLQKCRECRVVRSKKGEEPAHSPVFCRFYYFRRLSYSKNGVIRMDGFSSPDQFDDEAFALWVPGPMEESHLDQITAKYILSYIGDKFCQMVMTENIAASWIKKDGK
ncbi:hypothetical protein CHARACLAT_025448, partial [Characodon lateralis]|nr:hypothetical protein [Characodon lateralis]